MVSDSSHTYRALFSSDWSECLAPSGPFDCIFFNYPDLKDSLIRIFRAYTSNTIRLGDAIREIEDLLPGPITEEMMDAYLEADFSTYPGVSDLISWCNENQILFMLNTTGMMGTYQRIFAKALLPPIQALSAHPFISYPPAPTDPPIRRPLLEIEDKATNTEAVAEAFGIPSSRIIIMGDSGGDGPHFQWGNRMDALLIASRPKASLERFCKERGIAIHHRIGSADEPEKADFKELIPVIENYLSGS